MLAKGEEKMEWGRGAFIYLATASTILLATLCFSVFEPGMAGYEKSLFRNGLDGFISPASLLQGVLALLSIGLLPFHAKRFGFGWSLTALAALSIISNLALFHPSKRESWRLREVSFSSDIQNPFSGESFDIRSFSRYPSEHVALARRGYRAATVPRRRLTTYPPGLPMFYLAVSSASAPVSAPLERLSKLDFADDAEFNRILPWEYRRRFPAAAAFSLLHIAAFVLSVILAGLAGRVLSEGDDSKGLMAAAAVAALPALTLYNVSESALFVPIPLLALWASAKFPGRRRSIPFGIGVLYGTGLLFSLVFLPLILFHALQFILDERAWKGRFERLAFFACGAGAAFLLQFILFGYNPFEMIHLAISNNRVFYEMSSRSHFLSIPLNAYEFLLMSGIAWGVWASILPFHFRRGAAGRWLAEAPDLPEGEKILPLFLAVLSLLILSGSVRGEVGRNWMCLMPFLALGVVAKKSFDKRWFALCYGVAATAFIAESIFLEVVFNYWL